MAPRPAWKGYLKLSLVTCAVELYNASTQADAISFRTLNRDTGNAVKRQYVDQVAGKPVEPEDQVKGYEVGEGQFLLIEEDEIDAVRIESSHTLSLDAFVQKAEIDPVYLDASYYVAPADAVSEEAFAVIREALKKKGMAGMARVVLYRRERPAVIEPYEQGMLLTTLRYDKTVRKADEVFADLPDVTLDKEMLALAGDFVDKKKGKFTPDAFVSRYDEALAELIDARKKGRKPRPAKEEEKPAGGNVVNLFDALRKSLETDGGDEKKPAPKRRASAKKQPAGSSGRKAKST
jgi:DNA end-binding protein Ku